RVHERHRVVVVFELVGLGDFAVDYFPAGERGEVLLDLGLIERRHAALAGFATFGSQITGGCGSGHGAPCASTCQLSRGALPARTSPLRGARRFANMAVRGRLRPGPPCDGSWETSTECSSR